jgi:hypothetical protein
MSVLCPIRTTTSMFRTLKIYKIYDCILLHSYGVWERMVRNDE